MIEEMGCKELVELVTAYLDGVLSVEDRVRFEAHLAECEGCVFHLEQMQRTIKVVGATSSEVEELPSTHALLDVFRTWRLQAG